MNEEPELIPACNDYVCRYKDVRDSYKHHVDHCIFQSTCSLKNDHMNFSINQSVLIPVCIASAFFSELDLKKNNSHLIVIKDMMAGYLVQPHSGI